MKKRKHDNETADVVNIQKAKRTSGVAGISLIIFLLDKLSDVIYNALIKGFFGRIFTAYSSELSAYDRGCLKYFFRKESTLHKFFIKKNICNYKRMFFINTTIFVDYCKSNIIY